MTTAAELLRLIEADPQRQELYLVYADLLQAAAEPRGELIVLQHVLAGLRARRASGRERRRASLREAELRGALSPALSARAALGWQLGFIRSAQLGRETLRDDLGVLLAHPSARFLQLLALSAPRGQPFDARQRRELLDELATRGPRTLREVLVGGLRYDRAEGSFTLAGRWGDAEGTVGAPLLLPTRFAQTALCPAPRPGTFYVAGLDGQLYRLEGRSGTLEALEVPVRAQFRAIWQSEAAGLCLVGDYRDDGLLLRSRDEARTWQRRELPAPALAIAGHGRRLLVGGRSGMLLFSDDGGEHLRPAARRARRYGQIWAVWTDGETAVAVGDRGDDRGLLLSSHDAGETWQELHPPASRSWPRLFNVAGAGDSLVAVGALGTVLVSTDHGERWSPVATLTEDALYGLWGAGADLVACGAHGSILRSHDGGQGWSVLLDGADLEQHDFEGEEHDPEGEDCNRCTNPELSAVHGGADVVYLAAFNNVAPAGYTVLPLRLTLARRAVGASARAPERGGGST